MNKKIMMKLSKRFKVGFFSWIVLITCFISNNLWIQFITFEIFLALFIYDVILTKKSESAKLLRIVSTVILGIISMMLFSQKIHNNSIQSFNKNYEERNISTTSSPIIQPN